MLDVCVVPVPAGATPSRMWTGGRRLFFESSRVLVSPSRRELRSPTVAPPNKLTFLSHFRRCTVSEPDSHACLQ